MSFSRNASNTIGGFNYQHIVALYFFLKHIREIKSVNNEGENDVDIIYNDGTLWFLQAKKTKYPNETFDARKFTQAFESLLDNVINEEPEKVKMLGLVTNNSYPLTLRNKSFGVPYVQYKYSDLEKKDREKVEEHLEKAKDTDNKYQSVEFDLDKFSIIKIYYEGSDDDTKLQELYKVANDFINDTGISETYRRILINEWLNLFSRNAEEPDKFVDKETFINHTQVALIDNPKLNEFFDLYDIVEDESIVTIYENNLRGSLFDFELVSKIIKDWKRGSYKKSNMKEFIDSEIPNIIDDGNLDENQKNAVRLLIWMILTNRSDLMGIKKVTEDENWLLKNRW